MKRNKRALPVLLLGALALAAWCLALFFAQRLVSLGSGVTAAWTGEEAGVSPAQARQAERWAREDGREDFPDMTLWDEHGGQSVFDASDGGSASAAVLEFYGDGASLWPAAFLGGNYPIRGDGEGCAVDEALAFALWGSGDVLGRAVKWNGNTYYVRGVFRGGDGLLLTQSGDESAQRFGQMRLGVDDPEEAEALLNRSDMGGGALLDLPLLSWLILALAGAPALLLALGLLLRVLRRAWRLRFSPLLLCQYLPFALAGGALTLWAVGFRALPARLIPTKWSDFDFWARLSQSWADTLRSVFTQSMGLRELAFWSAALAAVLLTLAACLFLIPALERVRVRAFRELMLGSLASMALVFALTVALAPQGGLTPGRALWLLPTLWLLADGGLWLHQKSLTPKSERRKEDEAAVPPALEAGEKGQILP